MIEIVHPSRAHLEWVFAAPLVRAAVVSPWITEDGVALLRQLLVSHDGTSRLPVTVCFRPEVEDPQAARITHFPSLYDWVRCNSKTQPTLELRANRLLHAKLYLADRRALVGSANLTGMGFSLRGTGSSNLELLVRSDDPAFVAACWTHVSQMRESKGWAEAGIEQLANWSDVSGLRASNLVPDDLDLVPESWARAAHAYVPEEYRHVASVQFVRSAYAANARAAERKAPITYGDLINTLNLVVRDPESANALWQVLGAISRYEFGICGLMLSVLVGKRDTGSPGKGFFDLAKKIGACPKGKRDADFFLEHQVEVLRKYATLARERRAAEAPPAVA